MADEVNVEVVLAGAQGLHARPASELAQLARQYDATVTLSYGQRQADARSVLSLLGLAAQQGAVVTISARGEDAQHAIHALSEVLRKEPEPGPSAS